MKQKDETCHLNVIFLISTIYTYTFLVSTVKELEKKKKTTKSESKKRKEKWRKVEKIASVRNTWISGQTSVR